MFDGPPEIGGPFALVETKRREAYLKSATEFSIAIGEVKLVS